jgi:hypothetical protein
VRDPKLIHPTCSKRFVIEHEANPLFDLLAQLLAMAMHDDIFLIKANDVEQFYIMEIPSHRSGIELKIVRDKLDLPIFREPERSDKGYQTSKNEPMKSRTWGRNIQRLGMKEGLEQNLTQKVLRRGLINAVNSMTFPLGVPCFYKVGWRFYGWWLTHLSIDKAPSSVRDQIADHESNAVKYYINEMVERDTAADFLDRPSNEAVQREARLMTLMADRTAPTGITDEQRLWLTNHPKIQAQRERCKMLTAKCQQMGYASWKMAKGTHIYAEKLEADKALNKARTRLREKLKIKNRQRHFRDADVRIFNQQFRQLSPPKVQVQNPTLTPPAHGISERRELIRIICHLKPQLTWKEEHIRRLECI